MDNSQFFLDPSFCFDPNLGSLPDIGSQSMNLGQSEEVSHIQRKTRIRASRACIPCRSRHMKCDSIEPRCTRCQLDEKTCIYAKSRRGGSNRIDAPQKSFDRPTSRPSSSVLRSAIGSEYTPSPPGHSSTSTSNFTYSEIDEFSHNDPPEPEKLIRRYYEFFHNAHPILLPKVQLCTRLQKHPDSLLHLFPVLEFIGSIYMPEVSSEPFRQRAHTILNSSNLPLNGFSVQALALFALALHCSDEYKIGDQYLEKAIDIALSIKMHRKNFAVDSGEADASLEESWRRTWWMLYVLDGTFAAISHYPAHRLQRIDEEVELPCEDWEYERGIIPRPRNLRDYDNREFSDEQVVYSSFTYFIDMGRILSATLSINCESRKPGDGSLAAADAKFVNWALYLPKSKQDSELVKEDQKTDEVMFVAHVIINTLKLLLHRPHSNLTYSPTETASKCTPPSTHHAHSPTHLLSLTHHTAKSLSALTSCISLFAIPSPYLYHSPLTTCSLALSIMAQVSACNHVLQPNTPAYRASRDRIRLGLGVLRKSMECWFMAGRSVREVAGVARELLGVGSCSPNNGGFRSGMDGGKGEDSSLIVFEGEVALTQVGDGGLHGDYFGAGATFDGSEGSGNAESVGGSEEVGFRDDDYGSFSEISVGAY